MDVHGSPREGRGNIFTRGYSELFPAGGNLAGQGPGQTVLEVKLALEQGAGLETSMCTQPWFFVDSKLTEEETSRTGFF